MTGITGVPARLTIDPGNEVNYRVFNFSRHRHQVIKQGIQVAKHPEYQAVFVA
ncbi:hypothetical protein ACFPWW_00055 [Rhizobium sp. GCM10022189]|jgi:hypothetical protein